MIVGMVGSLLRLEGRESRRGKMPRKKSPDHLDEVCEKRAAVEGEEIR